MAITKPAFATAGDYLIDAGFFSGLKNIIEEYKSHGGLRGLLLRLNTAVEALIDLVEDGTGDIVCNTLSVGYTGAAYATGFYFLVDGTKFPTIEGLTFIDSVTGAWQTVTVDSGVVTVS